MGLVSEQCHYNLAFRQVEMDLLPACQSYGLGVIPWSPLGAGILAGAKESGKRRVEDGQAKGIMERYPERVPQYEAFCAKMGEKPADIALAWLLHQPVVTAPIIGPRTMEQFTGNIHALDIKLSSEQLKELDKIWPGPGGPAPEAYAW